MSSDKQGKRGGVRKTVKNGKTKRRSEYEFPYLEPSVALISRREETEDVASYAKSLPKEARAWMNQFMKEEVNADLRNAQFNTGKIVDIINEYNEDGEIVGTIEIKDTKKIYDRNNARNRCDPRQNEVFVDQVPDLYALEKLLYPQDSIPEEE